jgi:hypothetical protein
MNDNLKWENWWKYNTDLYKVNELYVDVDKDTGLTQKVTELAKQVNDSFNVFISEFDANREKEDYTKAFGVKLMHVLKDTLRKFEKPLDDKMVYWYLNACYNGETWECDIKAEVFDVGEIENKYLIESFSVNDLKKLNNLSPGLVCYIIY